MKLPSVPLLALAAALLLAILGFASPVRMELSQRSFVTGMAVDDNGRGGYRVTLMLFQPESTAGGLEIAGQNSRLVQAEGQSITETIDHFGEILSRRPFFGLNGLLIIGRELAQRSLYDLLNFFEADNQTRADLMVVMADGEAADLLRYETTQDITPADDLQQAVISGARQGLNTCTRLIDIKRTLYNEMDSAWLPVVSVETDPFDRDQVRLKGTALFSDARLCGFLSPEETHFFLMLDDTLSEATLLCEVEGIGKVTVSLLHFDPSWRTSVLAGGPHIEMGLSVQCSIAETEPGRPEGLGEADRKRVEAEVNRTLQAGIERMLDRAYGRWHCDLLGLSRRIRWADPDYWQREGEDWAAVCEALTLSVTVQAQINRTGLANGLML